MKKFSLVYIDDNLLNLEMFVDIFEDDFDISTLSNPLNALSTVKELKPDMVILDVHMPFKNGIQLFRELSDDVETTEIPVMFYSMDDSDETVSEALRLGPEDFLIRSMSASQIKARIMNRLNKAEENALDEKKNLSCENLELNLEKFQASIEGDEVSLTSIEFKILYYILLNQEKRIPKEELIKYVWGETTVVSRAINTHMTNLRNKIKPAKFTIRINRHNQIHVVRN